MFRVLVLALSLASPSIAKDADLSGRWVSELDGLILAMNNDGTFGVTPPNRSPLSGTWHIETKDGLYVFTNNPGSALCNGVEGYYRLVTNGAQGVLRFEEVDDDCTPRHDHMQSEFNRLD